MSGTPRSNQRGAKEPSEQPLLDVNESDPDKHETEVEDKHQKEGIFEVRGPSVGKMDSRGRIIMNRPVYNQVQFDQIYPPDEEKSCGDKIGKFLKKKCQCSGSCCVDFLLGLFPFINVLRTYKFRKYILGDILSGLSVGIMHIAQGMGFGLLASLQPIHGLYSSLFPVLLYFFFGTSRHVSFGTMALTAILVSQVVQRELPKYTPTTATTTTASTVPAVMNYTDEAGINDTYLDSDRTMAYNDDLMATKVAIATGVSFLAGVIQIGMGILRLGFVTSYLSDAFVGGFTTGAAFQITTSQMRPIFGIQFQSQKGPGSLIFTYVELFRNITKTNLVCLGTAAFSLMMILVVMVCINERFKDKMKMPIPCELIILIIGTLVSYFAKFKENFEVAIVGPVPRGIQPPKMPILDSSFATDAFIIAIISFVISVSMAKVFTRKYHYSIDTNQEMIAYGISNSASSFFGCFASAAAPPRCMVHDSTGGKTLVHSLISSGLVLLMILFISPLFEHLPNCVLAAIIVAALKGLFMQLRDLPRLWKVNKYDFAIWIVTWLSVVLIDITIGLVVGVAFSLLTVILRTQITKSYTLAKIPNTDVYLNSRAYPDAKTQPEVCIFRFQSALYYANVESFKNAIIKEFGEPMEIKQAKSESSLSKSSIEAGDEEKISISHKYLREKSSTNLFADTVIVGNEIKNGNGQSHVSVSMENEVRRKFLIIDCSPFVFIDSAGVKALAQVYADYKCADVVVLLAGASHDVYSTIELAGYFNQAPKTSAFHTITDAYYAAFERIRRENEIESTTTSL